MLDLVYILGKGSEWNDNELRYSLRSVQTNLKNHGQIFIVGERPTWLRKIRHLSMPDSMQHKQQNAINKILHACRSPKVSENFILMNDDFFFLKPTDADNLPTYSLGNLKQFWQGKAGMYRLSIQNSLKIIDKKSPKNFEVHYPMVINKKKFIEAMEGTRWSSQSLIFRSIYGNREDLPAVEVKDFKAYNIPQFFAQRTREFVSTDSRIVREKIVQRWFADKFAPMSRYETTP
jgi:hypothetical protein